MYIRLIYAFPCQRLFISFTLARITRAATAFIRHCKLMPENSICCLAQRHRGRVYVIRSGPQVTSIYPTLGIRNLLSSLRRTLMATILQPSLGWPLGGIAAQATVRIFEVRVLDLVTFVRD